jgi:hypothetical protein
MIKIKLFRAIDDLESCQKFVLGHRHVLENIGIMKVTSSNDTWMHNPGVYVLIVLDTEDGRVLGGARVHVANQEYRLPMEEATKLIDPKVPSVINEYIAAGTGEICGLWNSREVAGMGIGAVFLTRAAVVAAAQIGLNSLFALCAPYTVKMAENVGYEIEETVGNKGTFYYPKLDLLATFMILKDVQVLSKASEEEYAAIMDLIKNPDIKRVETHRKREVNLHYQLVLPEKNI